MFSLLVLLVPPLAFGYVICGLVVAFRSENPVVRCGFGGTAVLILVPLIIGGYLLFSGVVKPTAP